jgi:hypothetical protein
MGGAAMSNLLEAALDYHKRGFSIFPCKMPTFQDIEEVRQREGEEAAEKYFKSNAKRPLVAWKNYQGEKANEVQVRKWFSDCDPDRTAIAIITGKISGVTVVDVDRRDLFPELRDKGLDLPLVSQTGKGVHLIYSYDPRLKTTTNHQGCQGLDIRNDGGYIIAPPSPHYNGTHYQFIKGDIDSHTLSAPPGWLFEPPQKAKVSNKEFLPSDSQAQSTDLKRLRSALKAIPADNYDTWCKVGMALKQDLGEDALELWQEWSAKSEKYNPDGIDSKWVSFENDHSNPVTAGSIYHLAKENGWSAGQDEWPEPLPLPDDLHAVKPFDYELLPETLHPWAQDICERMQCPPDFVAVGIMAELGALIGRKISIRPQAKTDWTVIPNQWALIVGRPGALKSPALEQALAPLKRLAAKANDRYITELAEYELEEKASGLRADAAKKRAATSLKNNPDADILSVLSVAKPDVPELKRYIATDSTPEALGELLRHNPNGLLVHRDELVSLLKGLDREDRAEGRGFYLTGWNGDSGYTIDRIGRGMNLHIPAVCISLLGGTQPGRLSEYIRHAVNGGAADDGLIQRFGLLVWPDPIGKWKDVDRPPNEDAKREAYRIFDAVDTLDTKLVGGQQDTGYDGEPDGIPYLRFDDRGQELFLKWRTALEERLRSKELHPAFESHLAKYRKLVPGLALTIHVAEGGTGPVSESATQKAIAWSEYLETHAQRAYGCATNPEVEAANAILKHIRKGDLPHDFSGREVYRKRWAHLASREEAQAGLQILIDHDWLRENVKTNTGGRPATLYTLNPRASL